jgi:poly(A) polymerase
MIERGFLTLPDGPTTYGQMSAFFAADPVAIVEVAAAIGEHGRRPVDAVTRAAQEAHGGILGADPIRLRMTCEAALMGHDVDEALEWLHETGVLAALFPELKATVDLVQEGGRQHKDVWAHTKQVVKQTVRRPLVRWAALLHDIGKVPTRTYTAEGVHFHGHAEVGARMFEKVRGRFEFARDERQTIRFLIRHHLRTNQYSEKWTDNAVRRFHREMGPHLRDLLDLSRADITSKRPGRRKHLLEQISALADRAEKLAEADARLPPLPTGVGNAIMAAFELAPSRLIGELKKNLEQKVTRGELEARREDSYYVVHLAREGLVPGVSPERLAAIVAAGGMSEEEARQASAEELAIAEREPASVSEDDPDDGDPDRPRPGVLRCDIVGPHDHDDGGDHGH